MKVSIIMAAYNAEKEINKTIKSVLSQSDCDFELIIVDDCSTDNTERIVNEFKSKKIKYYRLSHNSGVSAARNYGIEKSSGEYLMFIDSDDEYEKNMVSKLLKEAEKGYKVSVCGFIMIENNKKTKKPKRIKQIECTNSYSIIEYLYKNELLKAVWNKIYSKKIIIDNNIKFDEKLSLGEDYRFNIDYLLSTSNRTGISFVSSINYLYYRNSTGLSMKKDHNRNMIKLENCLYHFNKIENKEYLYFDFLKCLSVEAAHNKEILKRKEIKNVLFEIKNTTKSLKEKMIAKIILSNSILSKLLFFLIKKIY